MEHQEIDKLPSPRENALNFVTALNLLNPRAKIDEEEKRIGKVAVVLLNKIDKSLQPTMISTGFRYAINFEAHVPLANPLAWSEEWKKDLLAYIGIDLEHEDFGIFEVDPQKVRGIEEQALKQSLEETPSDDELEVLANDIEKTTEIDVTLYSPMGNTPEEIEQIIKDNQETKRNMYYSLKQRRRHVNIWRGDYQHHWDVILPPDFPV